MLAGKHETLLPLENEVCEIKELESLFYKMLNDIDMWSQVLEKGGVKISKSSYSSNITLRSETILSADVAKVSKYIRQENNRPQWDELCELQDTIYQSNEDVRYVLHKSKPRWPASARDAYLLIVNTDHQDGTFTCLSKSIDNLPLTKGYVRFDCKITGMIATPLRNANGAPVEGKCRFIQISEWNLNGMIPAMVTSAVVSRDIPNSFVRLNQQLSKSL